MSDEAPLLTLDQVAKRLQVHPRTVQLWLREGELVGIKLGSGRTSQWRVAPGDLTAFIESRKMRPE